MGRDLERLFELLARDASAEMAQYVPSRARVAGTFAELVSEPGKIVAAVTGHNAYREASKAVAQDADLARIVTVGGQGPMLIAISGAPRVSPGGLVAEAIGSAAAELRCRGLQPRPENLTALALRNLDRLRNIGRQAQTEVATFLGFSGVSLPEGQVLALPWGTLSAPDGFYGTAEFMPTGRPTSCVLVSDHPLTIEIDESNRGLGPVLPKAISDHHDWTQLTLRLVSLAMALATHRDRVAPVPTFNFTLLPYETPIATGYQLVLAPPAVERRLDADEYLEIERCARILHEQYSTRLEVATRRIIAGLSQRLDPADRLIDAVTAWESLFSADQDASLRVTGSLAWLLEPDDSRAREALHREAATIYRLRSRVVHGGTTDPMTVFSSSTRATELAVLAIAALLERRPDLIEHDSTERSRRLLLGLS